MITGVTANTHSADKRFVPSTNHSVSVMYLIGGVYLFLARVEASGINGLNFVWRPPAPIPCSVNRASLRWQLTPFPSPCPSRALPLLRTAEPTVRLAL